VTRNGVPPGSAPSSTTTQPGRHTIDRALAVVAAILDEGGEGSLRLAEVSSRSGISIGSLYHHFGSREGMIDAARERQLLASLVEDPFEEAGLLESTSTSELMDRAGNWLRGTPELATYRRRRLETLAAAAKRPRRFAGVIALQSSHLDAAEKLAQSVIARGWLRDDVEPRAFALLLDVFAVTGPLREVDESPVAANAWDELLLLCIRGLLVSEVASCPA
jgi:AcrR family transcriptional regulator